MTESSKWGASRRDVLRTVGAVGVASVAGLSGTAAAKGNGYGNGNGIGAFLNEASEIVDRPVFTGQIADMRGMETVEVEVGNNVPVTPFEADLDGFVVTIEEVPFGYDPRVVRVSKGTRVDFVWSDDVLLPGLLNLPIPHNVVALPDKSGTVAFDSGPVVFAPNTYSVPFDEPGTYLYYCTPHGAPEDNFAAMRGAVVVSPK